MRTSESTVHVASALVAAQPEFPVIPKTRTAKIPTKAGGSYSYKYADLTDVLAAVVPVLNRHGLAVTQEAVNAEGRIGVATTIFHESGEWVGFDHLLMPGGGDAQAAGSAITYARRYALTAALGIAADEDDDGAASKKSPAPQGSETGSLSSAPTPSAPVEPVAGDTPATEGGKSGPYGEGGTDDSPSEAQLLWEQFESLCQEAGVKPILTLTRTSGKPAKVSDLRAGKGDAGDLTAAIAHVAGLLLTKGES